MDPIVTAAFTDSVAFAAIVTTILGGGLIGAIAAFRKAGPEVESISVKTMRDVIAELRDELTRLSNENRRLRQIVEQLEGVARENAALQARVERLEQA
jgi:ubiquinone biosynthesis protein UbiJ